MRMRREIKMSCRGTAMPKNRTRELESFPEAKKLVENRE